MLQHIATTAYVLRAVSTTDDLKCDFHHNRATQEKSVVSPEQTCSALEAFGAKPDCGPLVLGNRVLAHILLWTLRSLHDY